MLALKDTVVDNYMNTLILGSSRISDKSKNKYKTIINPDSEFIKFTTFSKYENSNRTLIEKKNLIYESGIKDSSKKIKRYPQSLKNSNKNLRFIRQLTNKNKPEDIYCSCYDTSRNSKKEKLYDKKSLQLIERKIRKKIKEMKNDNKFLDSFTLGGMNIDDKYAPKNLEEKNESYSQSCFSPKRLNYKYNNKNIKNDNEKKILEKLNVNSTQQKLSENSSFTDEYKVIQDNNKEQIKKIDYNEYNDSATNILNKDRKYRFLKYKKLIYDSFDDDEIIEDELLKGNIIYISPDNKFILIYDYLIILFTLYSLIITPINISSSICKRRFHLQNIINYFIDFIYSIDLIISFFRPYYNFEDQLIFNNNKIIFHYLSTYFIIDFICSIPFYSIFKSFEIKKNKCFMFNLSIKLDNLYRILEFFKSLKLLKIMSKKRNSGIKNIIKFIDEYPIFENYKFIFKIFISLSCLHMTTCLHIFISRNSIPNWIINNNLIESSYISIYFTSLYFIITTLTTVGYGDITGKTIKEIIFQIFLLIVGIVAYSWVISNISNIIQEKNKLTEKFNNKLRILDDIKLKYNDMSKEIYTKIYRHLEYTHLNYHNDPKMLIDTLPYGLKNSLLNEMYRPIIRNLNFFKNFKNSSFVLEIVRKLLPIRAYKNDILLDQGDIIENMILIKEGRLTLEVKININDPVESVNKLLNDDIFLGINKLSEKNFDYLTQNLNPQETNKSNTVNINSSFFKEEKEKKINFLHLKILEIRKGEHFGGLLLFLNRRTSLTLRVKTKKADLYFLKKIDVVEISSSYPNIWKRVNKISFHNLKQISKYMKKLIKQYCNTYGIKYQIKQKNNLNHKNKVKFNFNKNNTKKVMENNDNKEHKPILKNLKKKEEENNNKNNEIEKNDETKNNNKKKTNNLNNNLNNSKISNSNFSNYPIEKKRSKFFQMSRNTSSLPDMKKIPSITKKKDLYSTPFSPEEINDEIYIGEQFIIDTNNKDITLHSQSFKKLKSNISRNITQNKLLSLSTNSFSLINSRNNKKSFDLEKIKISKCNFLEFSSIYENINKISKYKYANDKQFQSHIKKKIKNKYSYKNSKNNRSNSGMSKDIFHLYSKISSLNNLTPKIKKRSPKRKEKSFFKEITDFRIVEETDINNLKKENNTISYRFEEEKRKNDSKEIKNNIIPIHSSSTQIDKINRKKTIKVRRKKSSLLNVISKNIINDTNALNNPNEFYTQLFNNILKDKEIDNSKKKNPRFSHFSPMPTINFRRSSKTYKE